MKKDSATRLLDANIVVFALSADAPQHPAVLVWLEAVFATGSRILIPNASALAYLRIATNPRLFDRALSVKKAIDVLKSLMHHPQVFRAEPGQAYWTHFEDLATQSGVAGGRLSDVHLAALAMDYGALLCSTDRDFRRFRNLMLENPLD